MVQYQKLIVQSNNNSKKYSLTYLYRRHEPVCYNAHAQEHVDECYKVNNGSCHFISYRGVLRVPDRQHHSCNQKKEKGGKR